MSAITSTSAALPMGTTAAPAATAAATAAPTAAVDETSDLNQPDSTYPSLIASHVLVLRAAGTSDAVISQIAANQPQAEYMERYIQGDLLQNPEGWDAYLGNPVGTARAGLTQLGIPLPAEGAGTPGYLADGSPVSGIEAPGLSTPLLDPSTGGVAGGGPSLGTGLLLGGAVIGAGLLAWKFMGNKNAGAEVATGLAGAMEGGSKAATNPLLRKVEEFGARGWKSAAAAEAGAGESLAATAVVGGGIDAGRTAATLDAIQGGFGPADGFLHQVGIGSSMHNVPFKLAADLANESQKLRVAEKMVDSGQAAAVAGLFGHAEPAAAGLGAAEKAALAKLLLS